MFLTLLLILCGLVYLWQKWHYSFWQRKGVPGPKPWFFVGNLGAIISQKEHAGVEADKWYNEFSNVPYIGFYKAFTPAIMLRDPELVKNVLIKDFSSFFANDLPEVNDPNNLLNDHPFGQTNEHKWRHTRGLMSPMFTTNKMKGIFPQMQTSCDKLIKYIERQGSDTDIDSKSVSAKFTTESVASCAFSLDANCFDEPNCEFRRMGKKIFQPSFWVGVKFMILFFFPIVVKFLTIDIITKEVDQWMRRLVKENIKSRDNMKLKQEDMLQVMLSYREKHGLNLTQITGHAISFFIDGYESSSSVLAFVIWEVSRNQEVQQKVYEEIVEVLEKHENKFTYEALSEMVYLDMVIQEAQRINAVALTLQKACTKPYEMPKLPGQKEPFILQPGTPVLIPIYSLHKDPEFYPNPEVFDPLRFSEEERQKRPRCAYLAFGDGPRMCVGMKFGFLQTKIAIANIVKNFIVRESVNCKPFVIDPRSLILQSRDGLPLRFEKRK